MADIKESRGVKKDENTPEDEQNALLHISRHVLTVSWQVLFPSTLFFSVKILISATSVQLLSRLRVEMKLWQGKKLSPTHTFPHTPSLE